MSKVIKRATVQSPGQIRHLLRITDATSKHPERDAVVSLLGVSVGMRITEIVQITVQNRRLWSGDPDGARAAATTRAHRLPLPARLSTTVNSGRRTPCTLTGHRRVLAQRRDSTQRHDHNAYDHEREAGNKHGTASRVPVKLGDDPTARISEYDGLVER